jgi:hypothetical protein
MRGDGSPMRFVRYVFSVSCYAVIAELTTEEVFWCSATRVVEGVRLVWPDFGPGYSFTVQVSSSLDPPAWVPPLGDWPITGTTWIDRIPSVFGRPFYRVKLHRHVPGATAP